MILGGKIPFEPNIMIKIGVKRMKKGMVYVLIMCLLMGGCFVPTHKVSAATFKTEAFNADGRVINITGAKITYRTQTGSSPESWAKPKTIRITSATKFYQCKGNCSNYTKYKAKRVAKKKAKNAMYNNGSNYVFFYVKGKKAIRVMYGMENYVG